MANTPIHGDMYMVGIFEEVTYGTKGTPTIWRKYTCEANPSTTIVNKPGYKTNNLIPQTENMTTTYKNGVCTLSGTLTKWDSWLLEALTADTDSPYVFSPTTMSRPSYTIYKFYVDAGYADEITGAVLETPLEISESEGVITFTANFRVRDVDYNQSCTYTPATVESGEFLLPLSTLRWYNTDYISMNTFTLSVGNTYASDPMTYQNTTDRLKVGETVVGVSGTLNWTWKYTYDDTNIAMDDLQTLHEGLNKSYAVLTLTTADSDTWTIRFDGYFQDPPTLPNVDNDLLAGNATLTMAYNSATYPGLSVTVA